MITNKWSVQKNIVRLAAFVLMVALMVSCSPVKKGTSASTATNASGANENLCNRTVQYNVEKMVVTNENGNETEQNADETTVFTLNPDDGKMTVRLLGKDKLQELKLRVKSCTLTNRMQSGEADYEVISDEDDDLDEDGNKVVHVIKIKVEAIKGIVTLLMSSEEEPGSVKAIVEKWEALN